MPYRNMSLDELARHIGMDAREVQRLAERGTLPGQRVGGQWRFNQAQFLDWVQREIHFLGEEHIRNLERATAPAGEDRLIARYLATEAVDMNLPARSRPSVLRRLVALAERTGLVTDPVALLAALEERENLCSTALAGGFAFPHPRRPLPYATTEPLIALARVPAGVPCGAPDRRTTDLFVLICSHEDRQHLCTLARLALMFSTDLPNELRETADPAEAVARMLSREEDVIAARR